MTGIYVFGLLLLALSAGLLAMHWREWKSFRAQRSGDASERVFRFRQIRRRSQASALIGLVGLAMTAADAIPKNPLALTGYLFGLIVATLAILWLAVSDLLALRLRQYRDDRDRLAAALREHARRIAAQGNSASDD